MNEVTRLDWILAVVIWIILGVLIGAALIGGLLYLLNRLFGW